VYRDRHRRDLDLHHLNMQTRERVIRTALWSTVVLNIIGAAVLAPLAIGRASPLWPVDTPPFYAALLCYLIALFGGVYVWLALQPQINRPMLVLSALGKAGFALLIVVYALAGQLPERMIANSLPDLLFAGVFLWWAWSEPALP
jgi:hypothetical protein